MGFIGWVLRGTPGYKSKTLELTAFLTQTQTGRWADDETAEAVFLAAQKEYEERKLPNFADLLEFMAFAPLNFLLEISRCVKARHNSTVGKYAH